MKKGWLALIALVCSIAAGSYTPAWGQEQLIPVRVRLGDVSLNKLIYIIAQEAGIYQKNGLQVEQYISPGAAEKARRTGVIIPRQFIRGAEEGAEVHFTTGGGTPTTVRQVTNARPGDWVILASTDHRVRWHIVAQPGIARPEQLKGKRIGFSGVGAMSHFVALWFVKHMGWDPTMDVSLLSNAPLDALQDGSVDAFVSGDISYTMTVAAGYKALVDLSEFNVPIAGSGVNASRRWLRNNRDTARRFIRSVVEAVALMKQNKKVALQAIGKWYGITGREKQEFLYRGAANLPRKPYPAVEGIKMTMQIYDSHEMRRHKPEDFYDDSFVRELDESGYIESLYK